MIRLGQYGHGRSVRGVGPGQLRGIVGAADRPARGRGRLALHDEGRLGGGVRERASAQGRAEGAVAAGQVFCAQVAEALAQLGDALAAGPDDRVA